MSRTIALPGYEVLVAAGTLSMVGDVARRVAPAHRYVVITDATVEPLQATPVLRSFGDDRVHVLRVPAGERHKNRQSWSRLTDEMLTLGCGRDTTIIALGGGVVGDLAGFVAATYMRGVPYVQVPTTLLAMIDSSIGGKTGVDTEQGKNLVGAFHHPAAVLADPDALRTLPPRHLRAGAAEAVKHGAIADAAYFDQVAATLPQLEVAVAGDTLVPLIARSIEIKADVVRRDERENGLRKTLNFGHTLGHAIEALSGYELLHGEAIAIGMALESRLAVQLGLAPESMAVRLSEALSGGGLPVARPADMDPEAIVKATHGDKKARAGVVEYALPSRIGAMAGEATGWGIPVSDSSVVSVLG